MKCLCLVQDAPFCLQVILGRFLVSFPLYEGSLLSLRMWGHTHIPHFCLQPLVLLVIPLASKFCSENWLSLSLPSLLWGSALTERVLLRWPHPLILTLLRVSKLKRFKNILNGHTSHPSTYGLFSMLPAGPHGQHALFY